MTPALQMRISSSLSDFLRKFFAAWETDMRQFWSQEMNAMFGEVFEISVMRVSAACALRPVK